MGNCCYTDTKSCKCPTCRVLGQSVPLDTVKSLVQDFTSKNDDFYICLSPDCDVIYFSHDTVFYQKNVVVPIAYKVGATPKFVCYCNRVTEEDIVRAVIEGSARTIGDVARLTGAMKNGSCVTNNPKGICCHKDIESVMQRALETR